MSAYVCSFCGCKNTDPGVGWMVAAEKAAICVDCLKIGMAAVFDRLKIALDKTPENRLGQLEPGAAAALRLAQDPGPIAPYDPWAHLPTCARPSNRT